jgi:hypothetical protein
LSDRELKLATREFPLTAESIFLGSLGYKHLTGFLYEGGRYFFGTSPTGVHHEITRLALTEFPPSH